ncbi:rhodanese-like domain-containing protein [Kangiella sp. M94]
MQNLKLALLLSITYFLASCASGPTEDAEQTKLQAAEFIVSVGEKVVFKDSSIEFLEIANDSRCPKGAQCVTEGQATLNFIYSTPTSAESFAVNTSDDSVRQFGDVTIGLVSFDPQPSDDAKLDPQDFDTRLIVFEEGALDDVTIIDVRTEGEYNNSHYSGAVNLPVDTVAERISELDLEKDQVIIVYCRSGNRAGKAKDALKELGYTDVLNGVNEDSLDKLLD